MIAQASQTDAFLDRIADRFIADSLGLTLEQYERRRTRNSPGQLSLFDDPATGSNLLRSSARQQTFDWDEAAHPRKPAGSSEGGQFAPKIEGAGGATATAAFDRDEDEGKQETPEPAKDEKEEKTEQEPEKQPEPKLGDDSMVDPGELPEPDPAKTPRENAAAYQKKLDEDYVFARASAIPNAGEDLKGSARHIRNQWRTLEEAESDGMAEQLVTRDQLLKNEPHSLGVYADSNPVGSLMLHEILRAFPPKPGYGSRRVDEETAKKNRSNYLDVYRNVKAEAERIAASGESRVQEISRAMGKFVSSEINRLRQQNSKTDDTANNLVNYGNSLLRPWQKSSVASKVNGFLTDAGVRDSEAPDGKAADVAAQVMEGKTFSQILGKGKGPAKPKGFSEAELYVATAERSGGPELPVKTAKESLDYLVGKMKLRGVQFGNSVSDAEREHHAKMSAGAMLDLADVTGLPLEAISLGGSLGLAMGARGKGNALAHYEPSTKVINLTRKSGVGSLAHEWAHAFDNSIKAEGSRRSFLSETLDAKGSPVADAMRSLRSTWESSGYRDRLRNELQIRVNNGTISVKKANDYWNTSVEIFARTFERHIQRKLEKSNRKNTYLAGIESKAYKSGGLWPTDAEVDAMAPAFEKLFDAHREHNLKIADRVKYSGAERDAIVDRFMADALGISVEEYAARKVKSSPGQQYFSWITVHPNGPDAKGQPVLIDKRDGTIAAGMGGKFTGQKIGEIGKPTEGSRGSVGVVEKPGLATPAQTATTKQGPAWGDFVKDKDGNVGIKSGYGGMGSDRVGMIMPNGSQVWRSSEELEKAGPEDMPQGKKIVRDEFGKYTWEDVEEKPKELPPISKRPRSATKEKLPAIAAAAEPQQEPQPLAENPASGQFSTFNSEKHGGYKPLIQLKKDIDSGKLSIDEFKAAHAMFANNREAFIADLQKRFNAKELQNIASNFGHFQARTDSKEKNAEHVYGSLMGHAFNVGEGISSWYSHDILKSQNYSINEAKLSRIAELVEKQTAESLAAHVESQAKRIAEEESQKKIAEEAKSNPQTLEDFAKAMKDKKYLDLTPEQRQKYDQLAADYTREQRKSKESQKAEVQEFKGEGKGVGFELSKNYHSKRGHDIFTASPTARVDSDSYNEMNSAAKRLGGWYYKAFGGTPGGFHFPTEEARDKFLTLQSGSVDRSADLEAMKKERQMGTAERLQDYAERLEERANETLGRDRLVNTARRAGMAASIEGRARADIAHAKTMRAISDGLQSGKLKYLDGVTQSTHLEELNAVAKRAATESLKDELNKKYGKYDNAPYDEREKLYTAPPITEKVADHAQYPYPTLMASELRKVAGLLKGKRNVSYERQVLESMANRSSDPNDIVKFGNNSWNAFKAAYDKIKQSGAIDRSNYEVKSLMRRMDDTSSAMRRLKAAGIHNEHELRQALREYIPLKSQKAGEDPVVKAERSLIGKKIPGFFPTPPAVIDRMMANADIQSGHDVLEPSAGKGDIIDQIKRTQPEAKIKALELNRTFGDVLAAKGHDVEYDDFLQHQGKYDRIVMNPPFESGQDIAHVKHAYGLLKPGGKLVAIMSSGGTGKRDEFDKWAENLGGEIEQLPQGSFAGSDAFRQTGVNTKMVTIEKPSSESYQPGISDRIIDRFMAEALNLSTDQYAARKLKSSPGQQEFDWITVHPNGPDAKGQPVLIDKRDGTIAAGMGGKFTGQKIGEIKNQPANRGNLAISDKKEVGPKIDSSDINNQQESIWQKAGADENRFWGTKVIVTPERKWQEEYTGTVQRVLNGGAIVEVKPEGQDGTFRVSGNLAKPIGEIKESISQQEQPRPQASPAIALKDAEKTSQNLIRKPGDIIAGPENYYFHLLDVRELMGGGYYSDPPAGSRAITPQKMANELSQNSRYGEGLRTLLSKTGYYTDGRFFVDLSVPGSDIKSKVLGDAPIDESARIPNFSQVLEKHKAAKPAKPVAYSHDEITPTVVLKGKDGSHTIFDKKFFDTISKIHGNVQWYTSENDGEVFAKVGNRVVGGGMPMSGGKFDPEKVSARLSEKDVPLAKGDFSVRVDSPRTQSGKQIATIVFRSASSDDSAIAHAEKGSDGWTVYTGLPGKAKTLFKMAGPFKNQTTMKDGIERMSKYITSINKDGLPVFTEKKNQNRSESYRAADAIIDRFMAEALNLSTDQYAARKLKSSPGQQEFDWITVHPNGPGTVGHPVMIDKKDGTIAAGMGGKFNGQKIGEIGGKGGKGKADAGAGAAQARQKPKTIQEADERIAAGKMMAEINQQRMEEQREEARKHKIGVWRKAYTGSPRENITAGDLAKHDWEKATQNGVEPDRIAEMIDHGVSSGVIDPKVGEHMKKKVLAGTEVAEAKTTAGNDRIEAAIIANGGHEANSANDVDAIRNSLYRPGEPTPTHAEIRSTMERMKNAAGEKSGSATPAPEKQPATGGTESEQGSPQNELKKLNARMDQLGELTNPLVKQEIELNNQLREITDRKMDLRGDYSSPEWKTLDRKQNALNKKLRDVAAKLSPLNKEHSAAILRGYELINQIREQEKAKPPAAAKPETPPAPSSFTPEMIPGQQASLFGGEDLNTGQKSLFNFVPPTKADRKAAKQAAGQTPASLLEQIDEEEKKRAESRKSLPGQNDLFGGGQSMFSANLVDRFLEQYRAGSSTKKAERKPKTIIGSKGDRGRFITVGEGEEARKVFLPGSVKRIKETGEYRTDNSQEKAKAARKKAKTTGLKQFVPVTRLEKAIVEKVGNHATDVKEFRKIVDRTYSEMVSEAQDRLSAIREVMAFTGYGRNAGAFINQIKAARDYDKIPRFDQAAEFAQKNYPHILAPKMKGAGGDVEGALFALLRDGMPETPTKDSPEVINAAWDRSDWDRMGMPSEWEQDREERQKEDDFVPFSARGTARVEQFSAINRSRYGAPQYARIG